MNLNIKSRFYKLYRSSWFITLFATTLGVLLAFYLNNLNSRSKVEHRKQISIENINKELLNNKLALLDSKDNDRLLAFLNMVKVIDNDIPNDLITSVPNMNALQRDYSDFIIINDSTYVESNLYQYNVNYKFNITFNELQNIAWGKLLK
jgi:hypothetical protein